MSREFRFCIGCSVCYAMFADSKYIDTMRCLHCSCVMADDDEQFCNKTCKKYFEIKYINYLIKNKRVSSKDIVYLKKTMNII